MKIDLMEIENLKDVAELLGQRGEVDYFDMFRTDIGMVDESWYKQDVLFIRATYKSGEMWAIPIFGENTGSRGWAS